MHRRPAGQAAPTLLLPAARTGCCKGTVCVCHKLQARCSCDETVRSSHVCQGSWQQEAWQGAAEGLDLLLKEGKLAIIRLHDNVVDTCRSQQHAGLHHWKSRLLKQHMSLQRSCPTYCCFDKGAACYCRTTAANSRCKPWNLIRCKPWICWKARHKQAPSYHTHVRSVDLPLICTHGMQDEHAGSGRFFVHPGNNGLPQVCLPATLPKGPYARLAAVCSSWCSYTLLSCR